jgi:excisionase family DNA binding protein
VIQKIMYSRREAARAIGVSVRLVDQAIADGTLIVKRIGRRVLISQTALDSFLAPEPEQSARHRGEGKSHA